MIPIDARRGVLGLGVALVGAALAAHADAPVPSLAAVGDADPLELARVVSRLGDAAVLRSLGSGRPVAERLAAVRAAPWLGAPERALPPLIELLAGRDSELAPAAGLSVARVASVLDADALARREVRVAELAPVRARLVEVAQNDALRADLRAFADAAAAALRAIGVP